MRSRFVGLLAALAMTSTFAVSTVSAAPVYADVTGYAAGTAQNNNAATWGAGCSSINSVEGSLGSSYVLPVLAADKIYDQVIVKAGSDESTDGHANTIFDNPVAGETVWADSNGSGAFDEGDKGISHIIICLANAPTSVSAAPASITPPSCTAAGTLVIPADTASVMYSVSPAYAAGASGTFVVTATAKAGFVLNGTAQWTLTVAPKSTDASCTTGGGTLPGNPVTPPSQAPTPVRQGTLASVPNTAMDAASSGQSPLVLLGLVTVAGAAYLARRNLVPVTTRR